MTELVGLSKGLSTITDDTIDIEDIDQLYAICAKVMSRNRENITISSDKLESIFDMEDLIIFLEAYIEFTTEVQSSKN